MLSAVKTCLPQWPKVHRLVASHFPPIALFERVADPDELEIVYALESLTNDRLKEEVGDLSRVPMDERIAGPGSSPLMAAFTHIGRASRFSDGTEYGVYYGAKSLNTAFAETIYHKERFLEATNEPDTEITMRCYINQVAVPLHDVRSEQFHDLYHDDYQAPQEFAKSLRAEGSAGLIYYSVRDKGGECVAAFKPTAMTIPVQGGHYKYIWNGQKQKIESVLEIQLIKTV